MKVYLTFLLGFAVVFVLMVAAWLHFSGFTTENPSHSPPDAIVNINGEQTTCSELFDEPCSFDLQSEFNQWGTEIQSFVNMNTLGPYARSIGFTAAAKLSLQACGISNTAGRTVLDFYDTASIDHPGVGTADLFPFWNESLQFLCGAEQQSQIHP